MKQFKPWITVEPVKKRSFLRSIPLKLLTGHYGFISDIHLFLELELYLPRLLRMVLKPNK